VAEYIQTTARSILRKSKLTDSWFVSRYGMNLYRGCEHACAYCDGRAEKYRVEGDFGRRIEVKENAPELLRRELARVKERGFVFIGGGVCDAYQPAEERFGLARACLEIVRDRGLPAHVLTKSVLVERDADLLQAINEQAGAIVSMSISSLDPEHQRIFEPGCAAVEERLACLARFRELGLGVGVMLMPVLPLLSDSAAQLEAAARRFAEVGVDFVLPGGLTLKRGRQMDHMLEVLGGHDPSLVQRYRALYPGRDRWGNARADYYADLEARFARALLGHGLSPRIPHRLYRGRVERNVEVAMVLAHIHDLLRMQGQKKQAYATASRRILELGIRQDVSDLADHGMLESLPGIGPGIAGLITELLSTGRCEYYEDLIVKPAVDR
jgi:DNA repair photolyase